MFSKDRFGIDLGGQTVTCPAGISAPIRPARCGDGSGIAYFGQACAGCPLRAQCTTAKGGLPPVCATTVARTCRNAAS